MDYLYSSTKQENKVDTVIGKVEIKSVELINMSLDRQYTIQKISNISMC